MMTFDNRTIAAVPHLISENRFRYSADWSDAEIRRFMRRIGREALPDLLALHRADLQTKVDEDGKTELSAMEQLENKIRLFNKNNVPLSVKELDIDGNELMLELGLKPGPEVGTLLEKMLDYVLEKPEQNTKTHLLERAKELIGQIA